VYGNPLAVAPLLLRGSTAADFCFDLLQFALEAFEAFGEWVGQVGVVERSGVVPAPNDFPRNADDGGVIRHRFQDDRIRSDPNLVADLDRPQHLRPRADHHTVAQCGVPFSLLFPRAAERDPLVEGHVAADLGRLADHHPHAMIDEESAADLRAGVNFDAGEKPRERSDEGRNDRHAPTPELMGDAVRQRRVQAGVGEQDFQHIVRGGIALEDGANIFTKRVEHGERFSAFLV